MFNLFGKSARHRRESAIGAAMMGGMMLLASFPMLFLNEGRAVNTARALKEGAASVIAVAAGRIDPANEGKFVHLSGKAATDETMTDDQFGVSVKAIRLARLVEMYQWEEIEEEVKQKKSDGSTKTVTRYSYEKVWSPELIDSSKFQESKTHENPREMTFAAVTSEAGDVLLEAFRLPSSLIEKIDRTEPLLVSLADVPEKLAANLRAEGGTDEAAGHFYWSANPEAADSEATGPEIGDVRIRFEATYPAEVSILSQQTGDTLQPFKTHSGRELHMLSYGRLTAGEMISNAEAANTAMTWGLRFFGVMLMCGGVGLVLRPLSSLSEGIPILGNVVGFGVVLIAVGVGGAVSLMVISVAWLFYRPLIAIPLLLLAVAAVVYVVRQLRARGATPVAGEAANANEV